MGFLKQHSDRESGVQFHAYNNQTPCLGLKTWAGNELCVYIFDIFII